MGRMNTIILHKNVNLLELAQGSSTRPPHSLPLPTTDFGAVDGTRNKVWILKQKTEGSLVIANARRELKWEES